VKEPVIEKKPTIRSFDLGDAVVEYLFYAGDGPTIIFLHATGFLPWLWHPIARRLCPAYTIIAPYFCDHRAAEPEGGGLSWATLAEDLNRLCEGLNLESPYIVGHSMGATVTTLAVSALGLRAKKAVLIEPIFLPEMLYGIPITVEQHPLGSKSIKRKNYWEDRAAALEYLQSKSLFKRWDNEMLELYIQYGFVPGESGGLTLACSPRKEAALFMGGMAKNPWPFLPDMNCPTLVVEGELSDNRTYIDLKKASTLLPQGAYHQVKDAGHLIPMEKPLEIVKIINEFFKERIC
jgi:Predicted hydrolases or acyltransferases (alpha/beta hydrolase superfamily)